MTFVVRDKDGVMYNVFYNKALKRTILRNQVDPVLFNEKGERSWEEIKKELNL